MNHETFPTLICVLLQLSLPACRVIRHRKISDPSEAAERMSDRCWNCGRVNIHYWCSRERASRKAGHAHWLNFRIAVTCSQTEKGSLPWL